MHVNQLIYLVEMCYILCYLRPRKLVQTDC
jgi:hypothetical protein